uniref:Ig-like domain-containing protein n=1 Tax=Myripristis murdjan TaxID=586833 RepID=A0A667XIU3_9TELE
QTSALYLLFSSKKITLFVCGTVIHSSYRISTSNLHCNSEKSGENIHWFSKNTDWSNMLREGDQYTQTRFAETGPFLNISKLNQGIFICLVLEDEQCVRGEHIHVETTGAFLFGSVGESVTLPCFDNDPNTTEITWTMEENNPLTSLNPNHSVASQSQMYMMDGRRSGNYSLIIPSLKLDHMQTYSCRKNPSNQLIAAYLLIVFSKFDPVTVFFSQGESAVLKCITDIHEITHRVSGNTIIYEDRRNAIWFRKTAERDYQLLYKHLNYISVCLILVFLFVDVLSLLNLIVNSFYHIHQCSDNTFLISMLEKDSISSSPVLYVTNHRVCPLVLICAAWLICV